MQGKIGLNYSNIILKHNKSILQSRAEADISVSYFDITKTLCLDEQRTGKTLESPIILTNMPSVQNNTILNIFNKRKWHYI
jgi:hypothetical protein